MNWRNPEIELPKEGDIVWVVYGHNKEHNPMSYEMMAGIVQYSKDLKSCEVQSDDMTGKGSWSVSLKQDEEEYGYSYNDRGLAWIYTDELQLQEWVSHDAHWGPKK